MIALPPGSSIVRADADIGREERTKKKSTVIGALLVEFLLIGYIKLFAIFFFTYRNTVCKWVVVTRIWLSAPAQEKEKHNADKDCDVDCAPRKLFHKNKTAKRIMPAV